MFAPLRQHIAVRQFPRPDSTASIVLPGGKRNPLLTGQVLAVGAGAVTHGVSRYLPGQYVVFPASGVHSELAEHPCGGKDVVVEPSDIWFWCQYRDGQPQLIVSGDRVLLQMGTYYGSDGTVGASADDVSGIIARIEFGSVGTLVQVSAHSPQCTELLPGLGRPAWIDADAAARPQVRGGAEDDVRVPDFLQNTRAFEFGGHHYVATHTKYLAAISA